MRTSDTNVDMGCGVCKKPPKINNSFIDRFTPSTFCCAVLHATYAVAAIKSGDDIKTVQENLGHATASFTLDVYGHVTEKMKQDSANRMEQFIQAVNA